MTNYESIMAILDNPNFYAIVKDNEGDYCVFTKDFKNIRRSYWYDDLERAKKNIGETCIGTDREYIDSINLVEIYSLPRELPNIKVGDKVVIMENARELDGFDEWSIETKERVNSGVYEVQGIENDRWGLCYRLSKDKKDLFRFPASCVCKVYKQEQPQATQEEIDKAIALLKDNGKIVDGKVLIG